MPMRTMEARPTWTIEPIPMRTIEARPTWTIELIPRPTIEPEPTTEPGSWCSSVPPYPVAPLDSRTDIGVELMS